MRVPTNAADGAPEAGPAPRLRPT